MNKEEEKGFLTSQFIVKMDFNSSIFSIVEIYEFNHVIRLCLQFRPGSDASIKAYLASSLQLSNQKYFNLQQELQNLQQEYVTLKQINREQATDLRTIRSISLFYLIFSLHSLFLICFIYLFLLEIRPIERFIQLRHHIHKN